MRKLNFRDAYKVRGINKKEQKLLWDFYEDVNCFSFEKDVGEIIENAYYCVIEGYMTDSPGYGGNIIFAVYSGSPDFFDVFTINEKTNKLELLNQSIEYKELAEHLNPEETKSVNKYRFENMKAKVLMKDGKIDRIIDMATKFRIPFVLEEKKKWDTFCLNCNAPIDNPQTSCGLCKDCYHGT